MAGRICNEMETAIKLFKTGRFTIAQAAAKAGVSKRGLRYALQREGLL